MHAMDRTEGEVEQAVPGKGMSFSHLIATTSHGDVNAELTRHLQEMGAALSQHFEDFRGEPKGEIGIKLKFKLEKGAVQLSIDTTVKLPKRPEHGELMFIDGNNNLTRDNPMQRDMGFPRTAPRAVT